MAELKMVLDSHFKHLKIDKKFGRELEKFVAKYLNSDREYLEFYGGNLLGVHIVRFKETATNDFLERVLGLDTYKLNKDLDDVETVVKINSVTSDLLNISVVYLLHRFKNSDLSDKDKYKAMYSIANLFFYRSIAAYISSWFTFPADPKVVKVAYSNMNRNSLIKKLGNWGLVVKYRSEDLISDKGIHADTIKNWDNEKYAYVISDSKDRIKSIIKNYYSEIIKARDSGSAINTSSSVVMDLEGDMNVADRFNSVENTVRILRNKLNHENGLIRDDYVYLIWSINKNSSPSTIRNVLSWVNENYISGKETKLIENFMELIPSYTKYLIDNRIEGNKNDIAFLLQELKALYLSSRSRDKDLDTIRKISDKIVKKAINKKVNKSLFLATRNSLILYFSFISMMSERGLSDK